MHTKWWMAPKSVTSGVKQHLFGQSLHATSMHSFWATTRERYNPYLATPGHIRDPILKWRTRPYAPVDVQQLAVPIRIHPEIRALSSGNRESRNFISSHGLIVKTSGPLNS
jgi:hypothetical protein